MKVRAVVTVVLVAAYFLFGAVFEPFRTNVQARMATGQVSDNPVVVALARQAAQLDLVSTWVFWAVLLILIIVWLPAIVSALRRNR